MINVKKFLIEIILIPALTTYCKPTNFPTTQTTSDKIIFLTSIPPEVLLP
ncbi:MAG: hypothetical protein QW158_07170 [Nitrososphaerales archaeon]